MSRPHLILITVDSLRYDALGCSGNGSVRTPNIDALAREAVVFDQAISNGPRTQAAFPSLLCSLYPLVAGEREALPAEAWSLSQQLRQVGYATAAFNPSNPFLTRETGYDRGFDTFFDFWNAHPRTGASQAGHPLRELARRIHNLVGQWNLGLLMLGQALVQEEGGQYLTGDVSIEHGLGWIRRQQRPFFLWLHLMDAHFPYHPLPGQRRWADRGRYLLGMAGMACGVPARAHRELRRLYDRRVELVDSLVGRVVEDLQRSGLDDRTVFVFTSDHGDQFGEHGGYAHGPNLYDELLRVPLLIRAPGHLQPKRIESQLALIDLAPTLLDLLGVPTPAQFEGQSRLSLLTSDGPASEHIFAEAMHGGRRRSRLDTPDIHRLLACRTSDWKYLRDEEGPIEELYDLVNDPGETDNLAHREPEILEQLRRHIDAHMRYVTDERLRFSEGRGTQLTWDDREVRRRLAELGYL